MTARLFVLISIFLLATGCASKGDVETDDTKFDGMAAAELYAQGSTQLERGNYELALESYDKLLARYPFATEAQGAQLDSIKAYYELRESDAALAAAEDFIKANPRHARVDYAYYLKGLINQRRYEGMFDKYIQKDLADLDAAALEASFNEFKTLIRRYPDSEYVEDARQRMIFLRNTLARHELKIAEYYVKRGAWVAVANRCQTVLENFDRSDAVPDALQLLATAYGKLGAVEARQETLKVLRTNFPDIAAKYESGKRGWFN